MLIGVPAELFSWLIVLLVGLYFWIRSKQSKEEIIKEALPFIALGFCLAGIGGIAINLAVYLL